MGPAGRTGGLVATSQVFPQQGQQHFAQTEASRRICAFPGPSHGFLATCQGGIIRKHLCLAGCERQGLFVICKCCFGCDYSLPQARLDAGALTSVAVCRVGGDGCVSIRLPIEVSRGEAKQYLISPSGLYKSET